jgi:predicted oxidoreductase
MGFNLNKREFKDALKLRYDWPLSDIPSNCVCGVPFNVDHAMIYAVA